MGILNFNFGSVIKPDGKVQTPNDAQQQATAQPSPTSLASAAKLARPAINFAAIQAGLANHPGLALEESGAKSTEEAKPAAAVVTDVAPTQATEETVIASTQAEASKAPIDLPVETREVIRPAPINETAATAVKAETNETKIDPNSEPELKGKALLNKFLAEVGEFFTLNNQLETIKDSLDTRKLENQKIAENFTTIQNDAVKIKEAIQTLQVVNDGPEGEEALSRAVSAFAEYQNTLDKQIAEEKKKLNLETNESLVKLNGIKAKLNKITALFGGAEKQKELLETIYKMNKVFERGLKKMDLTKDQESFVKVKMKNFFEAKDEMIAKDPEGVKMLMQSGDILGVLTLWVNEWASTNKIK
jgi:hypothetical protein